ncbi:Tat (twin-arginine translocation) pathway signal sequence [Arachidicoccus rhizosphaerae]|uniref:Tat (Twin-arginine translocation) pathway signal sequence n=1 Tax=Arachidicoccus rhizosphaerae TaxID=551991 RepID=A0A1H3YKL1_9BACT|nr:Gfo/Idh/MocA family oxidoreductase [Arachidicoccus rhizosphaerae]SEA12085.1 Tat (twin-arginine translocation) pathway signal sequence [Arachidicoccus rhizosphaerae]
MNTTRRDFVKAVAVTTAGAAVLPGHLFARPKKANEKVRLAFIGVGLRGESHVALACNRDDVEIVALSDINSQMMDRAKGIIKKAGRAMPQIILGDNTAYKKVFEIKDLDGVIIATPWEWHCPMILDAIAAGIKYVGTEVMLGITLEDHWKVVRAAEASGAHVMMLENVCYRRDVMAVMNMVRQNVFGELVHLQGGYQHNLRSVLFTKDKQSGDYIFGEKAFSEAQWRTAHSVHRNGDLYPTHGIGPCAMMVDINRGNRFLSLSSFDSKARGLHKYTADVNGEHGTGTNVRFKCGDMITTNIKCANGETILLQHDTFVARPYSLGFRVQGTEGLWMDVSNTIYVNGVSPNYDSWDKADSWLAKYDHPLWKKYGEDSKGAGHGGMDFFVIHAFVEAIKRAAPTPLDVYDAAAWSAITPLSERSIELGNQTVEFPDFTGGKWMLRKQDFALDDSY